MVGPNNLITSGGGRAVGLGAQYDVVLLPSYMQAENWRKRRADQQVGGLFAQTVTTFESWVADLWELHGDGRIPVGAMQRELLMKAVLSREYDGADAPGLAPLAAGLVCEVSGVPAYEDAIEAAFEGRSVEGVSGREAVLLRALAGYERALESLGLVELGCAAAQLAQRSDEVFPQKASVLLRDVVVLTPIQLHFLSSCSNLDLSVEYALGRDGIARAPESVLVRYAFPSGRLAQPGLIADEVLACAADGDVVVACKDPLSQFEAIRDRLADQGLAVCVQARKPFAQTDFGRAYLALCRCLHSEPWDRSALADALLSPFSGLSAGEAFNADKGVRGDRIVERDDVLAKLRVQSEPFSQLEELASDPDADVLIGAFEQMVQSMAHRSASWRAEQLAAMGVLREATTAARRIGAGIESCAAALERATVPISAQVVGSGSTVVFATQSGAARMKPSCCQSLIVADLTAEDYPVANRDDAATTLMAKLGVAFEESALAKARCDFSALLQLPAQTLVIMRPLGDDGAEATYPAIVLEEFIDAYRADATATDDIDNDYRLPDDLQDGLVERGEELLFANERAGERDATQAQAAGIPAPMPGYVEEAMLPRVVKPRYDSQKVALEKPCLSPSQVETYLECPYKWFATRRNKADELDEGFGPLQKGTFAHAAFEAFYRRFQERGCLKVGAKNLGDARELMRQVVGELAQQQFAMRPEDDNRLVYASELERREFTAFCEQLVSFLDFEAQLLPTFHPAYFEYQIDADHPVDYAGNLLVGKVDRIDVDDGGNAVIIDYKGSVADEFAIAGKDFAYAGKVQTRMYAQAVKRTLGLNVVGALYMSYGRKPKLSGAYDSLVLETPHLPHMKHGKCGCGTLEEIPADPPDDFSFADLRFNRMLDATEELVGDAIRRMRAGDVAPNPSDKDACTFCPVISCRKRGA